MNFHVTYFAVFLETRYTHLDELGLVSLVRLVMRVSAHGTIIHKKVCII